MSATSAKSWTAAEHRRLRSLYPKLATPEVAQLLGRSVKAIASRAKVLGITKAIGNGGRRKWSRADDRLLRSTYPHVATKEIAAAFDLPIHTVFGRAKRLGLEKTQAYMQSPAACRLRRGDNVGAAFRFPPGHVPTNKGTRRPGWAPGRMAETQFKKGQHPQTWMPIGSTRLMDGYLQRKVSDTGYPPRDWVGVHILMWQEKHGPIPPGHTVCFKDGNKGHIALENLELVSRRELMLRNSVHNLPPALKQVIQLTGALKRKIRNREEKSLGKEHAAGSAGSPVRDARSAIG